MVTVFWYGHSNMAGSRLSVPSACSSWGLRVGVRRTCVFVSSSMSLCQQENVKSCSRWAHRILLPQVFYKVVVAEDECFFCFFLPGGNLSRTTTVPLRFTNTKRSKEEPLNIFRWMKSAWLHIFCDWCVVMICVFTPLWSCSCPCIILNYPIIRADYEGFHNITFIVTSDYRLY